jgi:DNA-binding protein HU-beta
MTKAELVARMAHDAGLTKRQAEQVVEAFVASIQTALSRGEPVTVVGFGRFSVLARAARKGRNPRTGQEIVIPARKTPKFSAGKGLREAVKSPPQG